MKRNNLKKNFLYQVMYQILVLAFPFFTSPYISRVLGAYGLGVYSYSYSVAYYFVLFSMLGVLNYGNRAIAKVREDQDNLNAEFSGIVLLHVILSLICIVAYGLYCSLFAFDKIYAYIQMFYVISGLFDITWFYYGIEEFKTTITRNIIIKIGTLVAIFTLVRNVDDLWKYCLIMSLSFFVSQIVLWLPLHNYVSLVKVSFNQIKKHLLPLLVLFIPTIAISLYKYMDKIMIGSLSTKLQLGYYENSESFVKIAVYIINSLGTVMLPQMSNLVSKGDIKQFNNYINKSMRYVMILAFGMTFGLAVVAESFSLWYWGEEFREVGVLIKTLAITVPFVSFANVIRTQYLLPFERDKAYVTSVITGAIINLIINIILIPSYGAHGACIATVLAEVGVCVVQTIQVRNNLPIIDYLKDSIFFLCAGITMYIVVKNIAMPYTSDFLKIIQQILVGIFSYGLFVLFILIVKKDELILKVIYKK